MVNAMNRPSRGQYDRRSSNLRLELLVFIGVVIKIGCIYPKNG